MIIESRRPTTVGSCEAVRRGIHGVMFLSIATDPVAGFVGDFGAHSIENSIIMHQGLACGFESLADANPVGRLDGTWRDTLFLCFDKSRAGRSNRTRTARSDVTPGHGLPLLVRMRGRMSCIDRQ